MKNYNSLSNANIKEFMTENYGTDWYDEFYNAMYSLTLMGFVSREKWDLITKLDTNIIDDYLSDIE